MFATLRTTTHEPPNMLDPNILNSGPIRPRGLGDLLDLLEGVLGSRPGRVEGGEPRSRIQGV